MITRLNAVHALLYLIVSLLAVAVVFYTLGAPFVAALEVIIYAGAIMVLFVFVVMMLNSASRPSRRSARWLKPAHLDRPVILAGHPDCRSSSICWSRAARREHRSRHGRTPSRSASRCSVRT